MPFSPERLIHAMELRGIRSSELAARTGLSPARICQYRTGKYSPGGEALCRIAEVLNVSEPWLVGNDVPMTPAHVTPSPYPENISPLQLCLYPVLGRIACGKPILAVEESEEFIAAPEGTQADFCLIAHGDSMIGARIFDGDKVFISSADMVNNGEIAAVVVEDEATLKRVFYYPEENKLILSPENPDYDPLIFVGEELNGIRILGKATAVQTNL